MLDFILDPQVLGQTYFTISPLAEAALSLHQLGRRHDAIHARWRSRVRDRLADLDLPLLLAAVPPGPRFADCLLSPAPISRTRIEDQLDDLVKVEPAILAADLGFVWGAQLPPRLRDLVDAGSDGPARLADRFAEYWERVLRDVWPRMLAVLEADIRRRSVALSGAGLYRLLEGVHPEITVEHGTMRVDKPHLPPETLHASAMTLTPSIFGWPNLIIQDGERGRFGLIYGAQGVATTWEGLHSAPRLGGDQLALLLGRTRAEILRRADLPINTTQLARELGQSLGSVNEHLTLLRDSGLLESNRQGRSVLYSQTALARSLVSAQD
ncbi:ArsR/SmtB family transcription factor [Microlunatus soli]|uniref:Helix-turn-helix domain-containing protein n=1 Tax=Microlunatus soli TaxID=630515 RepID=A0A1H1YJ85_9ACTN|nr:DUF5937 family protein [Microlunatus soli]SDT21608.1 hypothetical protein SAMN04489812_4616 [Microlunatus soli]